MRVIPGAGEESVSDLEEYFPGPPRLRGGERQVPRQHPGLPPSFLEPQNFLLGTGRGREEGSAGFVEPLLVPET